ncbi:MAG: protein BatD [Gammaproteobacteria bacterium]|nr:protein BatD [Gammaproteobacteria bacterium]
MAAPSARRPRRPLKAQVSIRNQPTATSGRLPQPRARENLVNRAFRLLWLLAVVFTGNVNAAITATLDRQAIDELSTVQLTLLAEGASQAEKLDVSPLEGAFEVLGTNTTTQFRSVNGQVSQWVEYQINLRPKRSGSLDIPPLSLGGQQSPPLRLQVIPLDAGVRDAIAAMIFFESEASPNPVRVQAQTILTRSLFYANGVQIYSDLPAAPEIPGALVIPLGENRSATAIRQGRPYGVLEQRYAVFPEQKGRLRIPEISVMSSVRLPGPAGGRRSGIRVITPEIQVDVLPIPPDYAADHRWMPAEAVSIAVAWQPADPRFHVGEPVQRTIRVNVVGNTGSAVPPLNLNLSERFFKQYPEPVRLDDGNSGLDAQGSRQETHSIIPVYPGEATLPTLKLTWWDSVNERVQQAVLPGRTLRITGEAPADPEPADETSVQEPQRSEPANAQPVPDPETDAPSSSNASYPVWLLALTAAGFVGWMATWLLMRHRRRPAPAPAPPDAAAIAWKALNQACKTGRMEAMRNAWLKHLSAHWQLSAPNTLARIRRTPKARELLGRLNRALYASDPSGEISGQELLGATRALVKEEQEAERTAPPLSALHG